MIRDPCTFSAFYCFKNLPATAEDLWISKIPWRRTWQPTPVFLFGKAHGQRSLTGYSPWSCKRVRHNLVTKRLFCSQPNFLSATYLQLLLLLFAPESLFLLFPLWTPIRIIWHFFDSYYLSSLSLEFASSRKPSLILLTGFRQSFYEQTLTLVLTMVRWDCIFLNLLHWAVSTLNRYLFIPNWKAVLSIVSDTRLIFPLFILCILYPKYLSIE